MSTAVKLPFYAKASLLIIGAYFFVSSLYILQSILLPLIFALIFAVALSPIVNFLVRKKIHRVIAIAIVSVMAVIVISGLFVLLTMRATNFGESLPLLADKFQLILNQLVSWLSANFNIDTKTINSWIDQAKTEFLSHGSQAIGSSLSAMGFLLEAATLTIVYICMILYYQSHLIAFVHELFSRDHNSKVSDILNNTKAIIQAYLLGLGVEFFIIAILNFVGLLLLNIEYALILGIIGAFLNIIPYIGGLIGVALFMAIALVTKAPIYMLYVVILYSVIQFVDNNYIVPKIIGSKVKLNALVAVIAVIIGAELWGIQGMFLSIPLTAILKLIFDQSDSLKPWGLLLGDEPIKKS